MARDGLLRFWKKQGYACGDCGRVWEFLLETGLEGPRHHRRPPPGEPRPWGTPIEKEKEEWDWYTVAGRLVLPVPFVAMGCPDCQGPPPWEPGDAVLYHVPWLVDEVLAKTLLPGMDPPKEPHFLYPENWMREEAHGVPVFPGLQETEGGATT